MPFGLSFPTTKPWELGFTSLPRAKMLVAANSGISWSYTEAVYYCQARGIPVANIVQVAMGADGRVWSATSNAQIFTNFVIPLRNAARAINACAIILGPAVPIVIATENQAHSASDQLVPTHFWASSILGTEQGAASDYYGFDTGAGCMVLLRNVGAANWRVGTRALTNADQVININAEDDNYYLTPSPINQFYGAGVGDFKVIPPATTKDAATGIQYTFANTDYSDASYRYAGCPLLPVARIGFETVNGSGTGGTPVPESQAVVRNIIDSTTAAMRDHRREEALQKPMLFNLSESMGGATLRERWAWFYFMARQWGINAKYSYYTSANADSEVWAPNAGAEFYGADVLAGTVHEQVYLNLGGFDNRAGIYTAPFPATWIAMPGASMMFGPSSGVSYSLNLLTGGGSAISGDPTHITTFETWAYGNIWHNLLRGMTWLEAAFYYGGEFNLAMGDPLWAPYAVDDIFPENTSATIYTGRNNLDQRTGFLAKKEALRKEWTGILTENPEPRHPQDFVRQREPELKRGSPAPEKPPNFLVGTPATTQGTYDYRINNTIYDGRELVGTGWQASPTSVGDLDADGAITSGGFDYVGAMSFPSVNLTSCLSASLQFTCFSVTGAGNGRLYAESQAVAPSALWSATNLPIGSGATAVAQSEVFAIALGTTTLNVTTMVQQVMAGAQWASGNIINFWMVSASVGSGGLYNSGVSANSPRLTITDNSVPVPAHEAVLPSDL